MFSMLPTPVQTYYQSYYYTPAVSSPLSSSPLSRSLSPRDINVPTSRIDFNKPIMSPTPTPSKTSSVSPNFLSTSSSSRESAYSKRISKVNPLIHGRNGSTYTDGRDTRRKLFLKRVREDSEDKKWKARGGDDEMMRYIWISEQRRQNERQQREAIGLDYLPVDEEDFLSLDEIMADEVALREEAELEALIANQTSQIGQQDYTPPGEKIELLTFSMGDRILTVKDQQPTETLYGSDDDDYDHIFMDVIQEENRMANQSLHHTDGNQDMMDIS